MNDLRFIVADLHVLADAYARRAHNNGPGHPDNDYLHRQADRFHKASEEIRAAILDARSGPGAL